MIVVSKLNWLKPTIGKIFGESSVTIARKVTKIINSNTTKREDRFYYTVFYVYIDGKYTVVYTNFVVGCPTFYPIKPFERIAFKDIGLSEHEKAEICELTKDLKVEKFKYE